MGLVPISRKLAQEAARLKFGGAVAYVYNPLVYAKEPHEQYLSRFGQGPKEVLFIGMNPGPFGMAQTGVPFGDVAMVRDWMGIDGRVSKPQNEHPKRPVKGFGCHRGEVSGARLWGWARDRFGSPERFFERFFVHNYCPLAFLEESGRNLTPDKLAAAERRSLIEVCDRALAQVVEALEPRYLVGIGAFAEKRARQALGEREDLVFGRMLHPSPASPKANQGWTEAAEGDLEHLGIQL
jgi:single-strand selective monofunctional uracil DNA glycosylase